MARSGLAGEGAGGVLPLVHAIHAAGVGMADWPAVLDALRHHLEAQVITLALHEFATGAETPLFEAPADAQFSRDMAAFAARNPWFLASDEYRDGRVMTGDELIAPADLRRTDFYRGFLEPRNLLHRLCGVVARRSGAAHVLSAYRTAGQPPFGPRERTDLELLVGHVALALQCQWRWQEADDLAHALLGLSDRDANAALLVTAQGELVYRNPAADRLLEHGIGLRLDGGRLVAASTADRRLLADTIARMARPDDSVAATPAVVTLACPPPAPPVIVIVRAAGPVFRADALARRGLAMIAVRGTHAVHDPASCAFARRYDLTAAQAKVSALVFAGQSLSSIAQSLNVSENTVRSHLKQIFQKTDTHGQMDLVHLHARTCPTLP